MTYADLFRELVRTEIEFWNLLDTELRSAAKLTVPQFQGLSAIDSLNGSARVQDISGLMSITVGATSKLVDRLERDGLAVRQSNPTDRRSSIVVLTDAGRQALVLASAATETTFGAIFTGSDLRVSELTEHLGALRSLVEKGVVK